MKRVSIEDEIRQAYPFITFSLAQRDGETPERYVVVWDDFGNERGVLQNQQRLSITLDCERPVFRLGTYEELGFLGRYRVDAGVTNVQVSWLHGGWECQGASRWTLDPKSGDRWPGDISEFHFNEQTLRAQPCSKCGVKNWSAGIEFLHGKNNVSKFFDSPERTHSVPWHRWAVRCSDCGEDTHIPDSRMGWGPSLDDYVAVPAPYSRRVVAYAHWLLGLLTVLIAARTGAMLGRLGRDVGFWCGAVIALNLYSRSTSFLKGTIRPRKELERIIQSR